MRQQSICPLWPAHAYFMLARCQCSLVVVWFAHFLCVFAAIIKMLFVVEHLYATVIVNVYRFLGIIRDTVHAGKMHRNTAEAAAIRLSVRRLTMQKTTPTHAPAKIALHFIEHTHHILLLKCPFSS